jgi:hypothetical protein
VLRPADALLLVRVSCVAALVPAVLHRPLPWVSSLLTPRRRRRPAEDYDVDRLVAAIETAQAHGRPLIRSGCLTRSLTLYWFLARRGMPVELCFGLAATEVPPSGHAWLCLDGQPFLERVDPTARFTVTYRIGPRRP